MSWLDKLLGRGKKPADDMMGDSPMKHEGMHQEQPPMGTEGGGQMPQEEGGQAGEHEAPRDNP